MGEGTANSVWCQCYTMQGPRIDGETVKGGHNVWVGLGQSPIGKSGVGRWAAGLVVVVTGSGNIERCTLWLQNASHLCL